MDKQRFTSVWDAIEDTPEQAANMKLRSVLMIALKDHITRTGMSQAQAAQLFGVTQPRACASKCTYWKPPNRPNDRAQSAPATVFHLRNVLTHAEYDEGKWKL